jgi:quercetin dioxygenase-like cupin family protein
VPAGVRPLAVTFVAVAAFLAACLGGSPASIPPSGGAPASVDSVPPVVRDILAAGDPSAAPGAKLELVRYTIQPGTRLATHRHPGMQLARIDAGTLTYTVVEGVVTVHEADGGTRDIRAGETDRIEAGEWMAEHEGVVHFGENAGPEAVVILASSLLEADQPPAIPVGSPAAS